MGTIQLTIKRWAAWMPGITTRQDWQDWQAGVKSPLVGESPAVQEIPPLLRRRLSPMGKMALSVAWPLLRENGALPSLFCSRHGELERTVAMLKDLARGHELSPTRFSLSVHNAIGGIWSIARGDTSPVSALALGNEDLSMALLETRLILAEQRVSEALCVIYDAPLPADYAEFDCGPGLPYAAAFIVTTSSSDGIPLSLRMCGAEEVVAPAPPTENSQEPQTLRFLRYLLTESPDPLLLSARRDYWQWS
ncbi:MAG: beta-ketoacyl synthase chain length factor [Cellvibrionaceae bacterium]